MSLDDPGLDTASSGSGSTDAGGGADDPAEPTALRHDPADHQGEGGARSRAASAVDPSTSERARGSATPDELIALAEREQADREQARRDATELHPVAAAPGDPDANGDEVRPTRRKKRRARKVRRIVRRLDAWSVLKFSLLFFFCVYVITMVAGVLLWNAAQQAGTIEGFEGFIADLGAYETFTFEGEQIFNGALIGGLVLVLAGSAGNVLLAVLFNLISDLTGGIRVTVIEEERVVPVKRRTLAKRPPERRKTRSLTEMSSTPDQ